MAVPWQSFTTVPTGWANDSFGLNLEFELHLEGVEEFWVQQHRQIDNTAIFFSQKSPSFLLLGTY